MSDEGHRRKTWPGDEPEDEPTTLTDMSAIHDSIPPSSDGVDELAARVRRGNVGALAGSGL